MADKEDGHSAPVQTWDDFVARTQVRYQDDAFWRAAVTRLASIPVGVSFTNKDIRPHTTATVADLIQFSIRHGVVSVVDARGITNGRPPRVYQRLV